MATSIIPHNSLKLLWTNSSPNTAFDSQLVSIDVSKYTAFVIAYLATSSDNSVLASVVHASNTNGLLSACTVVNRWRGFTIAVNGISFGNGRETPTYGNAVTNQNAVIPYSIYGIV